MSLLSAPPIFKPFNYPWCYEAWQIQQRIHWLPEEVPLADDVKDWQQKLRAEEKHLLTQIFRFFTQADVEVNNCYMKHYAGIFKPTEVCMMLAAFSNIETIHIDAYSHLLDTIGMPEIEYQAFMKYKEMKDKYEYMQQFNMSSKRDIALTLAVFGAFTEGVQLFASFVMLLNFPRFGKMKGMGQIVTWSVRDETLHTHSIIRLFRTFIHENVDIWDCNLKRKIYQICLQMIAHEDAFIDLAFEFGAVEGLTPMEVKSYIRYIADRRLRALGLQDIFSSEVTERNDILDSILNRQGSDDENDDEDFDYNAILSIKHPGTNPLPWVDEMLNCIEHANFFENRVTEYSRSATKGTWEEVFSSIDATHVEDFS